MALSVTVNLSAYPEGIQLGIEGIGVVDNGGTVEVLPDMEPVFYSINGDTIENVMAEQEEMQVSGSAEWQPDEPVAPVDDSGSQTPDPTPAPSNPNPDPGSTSGLPPQVQHTEEGDA